MEEKLREQFDDSRKPEQNEYPRLNIPDEWEPELPFSQLKEPFDDFLQRIRLSEGPGAAGRHPAVPPKGDLPKPSELGKYRDITRPDRYPGQD